jgi:hypothetical protein
MMPPAAVPAQMPIARPRSSSGKVVMMMDRVAGMISAAPTPIAVRVPMSIPGELANAEASDPATKTSRPEVRASLRPNRSPRVPMDSNRPA